MTLSDDFIGQRTRRIESTQKLRALGIDPYTPYAKKDHENIVIKGDFDKYNGKEVTLTGRLIAKREHGKLIFGDIQDQSGSIQIGIKKDEIQEDLKNSFLGWDKLSLIDTGDFIQVTGTVNKTQQGEVTIFVKHFKLLTKSLRPHPVKFEDKEQQFRRRYVDLTVNPERKKLFQRKTKFWQVSREFMMKKGFIEVETPVLEHVTGGADARPFVTHHNTLDQDFFLRISTELYQKRLIGSGFEKIFTLGPNFRNEGLSDEHLQEFYQLEWYWAYANYRDGMELIKEMFREIAQKVYGKTKFTAKGHTFDLAADWEEIDYTSVIKDKYCIDIFKDSEEKMLDILKKKGIELPGLINKNRIIDNLWKTIRKNVAGPAFLINQPQFISPLAKSIPEKPELTQRFQIIIAGSELGNGYSELNDPADQLSRFLEQQKLRDAGDEEAQMLDIDYVEMLEYGMPPTCGYGHSERIFWALEGITAREGTLFPQMRSEVEELTKKIYEGKVKFGTAAKKVQKNDNSKPVTGLPTREEALKKLEEHVKEPYQIIHAKMVAAAMEMYAKQFGANADLWYITGLLHDLDYFEFPDEHPKKSLVWFKEWGYPQELIDTISAHAFGSKRTDTPPKTQFDFALIACDEMAGLLYAYSLMRPTKFTGMEAKSAIKKFKDKSFAAKIDRQEILVGVEGLGLDLKEHATKLIEVFNKMKELK